MYRTGAGASGRGAQPGRPRCRGRASPLRGLGPCRPALGPGPRRDRVALGGPSRRLPQGGGGTGARGPPRHLGATHVIPCDVRVTPFSSTIQPVYDEIGEGLAPGTPLPRPGELPANGRRSRRAGCSRCSTSHSTTGRDRLRRRGLHRAAEHVLRAYRHAGLAARPPVRGAPRPSRTTRRRARAPAPGQCPARRPSQNLTTVSDRSPDAAQTLSSASTRPLAGRL